MSLLHTVEGESEVVEEEDGLGDVGREAKHGRME